MNPVMKMVSLGVLPTLAFAQTLHNGYALIDEPPVATDLAQTVYRAVQGPTVGQGLYELLIGTGYRLAEPQAADPAIGRLYVQPYPEAQRDVGPVELGIALERLAGPAWQLVVDPVNRLVSFERRPPYRPVPMPMPMAMPMPAPAPPGEGVEPEISR
jgi:type IV pili sensor histidine kinase/response regulator